ncbi:MAG: hypothetical protein AAB724_00995, partial [Patescibacteria group bacterium]
IDWQNPDILYSGSQKGLLKSVDAGQFWERLNIVIPPSAVPILAVAQDPINPDRLYYAAGNVVYRTFDRGQTWSVQPLPTTKKIKVLTIDPRSAGIIYAGIGK